MNWNEVGQWLKSNAGTGASLVGSLLIGNVKGAVAAGIALVSSATGTNDPTAALQALQQDPATLVKLRELAVQEEASIRLHIQAMAKMQLEDAAAEHHETQETIRNGDRQEDPYVRHTRPLVARQSWYATMAYVIGMEALKAFGVFSVGPSVEFAMLLVAPASAYIGFRTLEKRGLSAAAKGST